MSKIERKCKTCNESFLADTREINRGNALYCSRSCAAKAPKLVEFNKVCKHCGKDYIANHQHSKFCSNYCKQKNYRLKSKSEETNMKQLYKLFQDIPCEICGWNETSRDLHHIIEVSKGGKNEINNIISVCPNHHRMIHKNLISKDELLKLIKDRTISSS